MTAQQSHEEYVRSVWKDVELHISSSARRIAFLKLPVLWSNSLNVGYAENEAECWQDAFEFTQNAVEEVRKLREEISLIQRDIPDEPKILTWFYVTTENSIEDDPCRDLTQRFVGYCRILQRLEAILAEKTRGMREEFLKELK